MTDLTDSGPGPAAYTVSELNREVRQLIEDGIGRIWVEGEISNLSRPASGHIYFSLKDPKSQLRCAWFRNRQRGPAINFNDGDQVLAFGQVSVYEVRGEYQLIVEQLEAAGEGLLRRKFEELKKRLAKEGLFDEGIKKPLPALPTRIGVVTSATAAALRDVLSVLRRRFPAIPVIVYPTQVQGDFAAAQIEAAIDTAANRAECDVLIVCRGGGSLEDLWPFNEEVVARAIHRCPIPVVSAVGHEVDVTIADFVADLRAPTPSGAAELVVPDQREWARTVHTLSLRLQNAASRELESRAQMLDHLGKRLTQKSPAETVRQQRSWLTNLQNIMVGALRHELGRRRERLHAAGTLLIRYSPAVRVQQAIGKSADLERRLRAASGRTLEHRAARLALAARALDAVSPLNTLDRGYAILTDSDSGKVLQSVAATRPGSAVSAQLADGVVETTVTAVNKNA